MSTTVPLNEQEPTRVSYHDGLLLDAEDFRQEQGYHRGRLAAALARIHGFGTISGLRVERFAAGTPRPEDNVPRPEEELGVSPGLALDREGRLIEVAAAQCLRLNRWFDFQAGQPGAALKPWRNGTERYLVGDVFLRYRELPQGLRPAFPEPAADATDAVVASTTLESFELILTVRDCDPETNKPATPARRFTAAPADRRALLDALYAAYGSGSPPDGPEYPLDFPDKTAVFLSRVLIQLEDAPSAAVVRHASTTVVIEDLERPIVAPGDLLATLLPTA
jgi:hypothetical protein